MTVYVDTFELESFARSTITADTAEIAAAGLAAEASINAYCHRTFAVPTTATARTFAGSHPTVLVVPDIANTTNLVIVDNGSTLSASDYQLEVSPNTVGQVGIDGRTYPYTRIRRLSGSWHIDGDREATISVTARWGWPAIPNEVVLATKLLTRDYLLARDTPFGIVQVGDFSRRIAANGVVVDLLGPLRRVEAFGVA